MTGRLAIMAFFAVHFGSLITMAILLVVSAFFSGSETALFNLTRGQLYRLRDSGGTAHAVMLLMSHPNRTLHSMLMGNLLVNVAYSSISAIIILDLPRLGLAPWAVGALSLAPLLVLILVGEVMPKMLAYALAEAWALPASPVVLAVTRLLAAPIWVLDKTLVDPITRILAPRRAGHADISADELASVMGLSARRGIIDHDANALLQEIVGLTDLRVADICVPRVDVIAYDVDGPADGLLDLFRSTRLRRIPVYEGHLDRVLGLISAKRFLLQRDTPLRQLVQKAVFVPEAGNIERLLALFRARRAQTAIVVDEYGGTAGLVTLQDVLEEIVGDIPEPHEIDLAPPVRQVGPHEYVINADLAVHEWADAFGIDLSSRRISTVGGFVTSLLGRIPRVGDAVDYRNLHFEVQSMRRRRISKLRLELQAGEEGREKEREKERAKER